MSTRLRERTEKKKQNSDKRPIAIAKYIRIPSSKVKLVLDLVRGKSYEESVSILKNMNKSSSPVILKVLESAAANAENNLSISKDSLFIAECYATAAPTMKRMMPRARGRADRILKRTCHITIILDELNVTKKVSEKNDKKEVKLDTKKDVKADVKKVVKTDAKNEVKKEVVKVENKEIPTTKAEKPLTDKPNTVKPLGTKKVEFAPKVEAKKATSVKKPETKKEVK